ncbi:hypothetical protein GCM10023315_07580 [Algibacter aquimarinus]|uniref:Uncharacterized protein n=2 Tax=Algibacter aquimarinus TaxID=1136748 RepID=A0ABP9H579_9FLAO
MFSQTNLNEYKYVIVSKKYDFLKRADQYQLNSLSKFLFNKYGFEALMEGEPYPADLIKNRCLALKADVLKGSGMFKTKLTIQLTDCNDRLVYTSGMGESREKEFKKAYTAAIRQAFKSFEAMNYTFEPKESEEVVSNSTSISGNNEVTDEIKKLKQEIEVLKNDKKAEITEVKKPVVTITEKPTQKVEVVKAEKVVKEKLIEGTSNVLYAQEIDGGFQLVDSSPKVIYKIFKTGLSNVYLVEDQSAIIYKEGDNWVIESYGSKQELNVKF